MNISLWLSILLALAVLVAVAADGSTSTEAAADVGVDGDAKAAAEKRAAGMKSRFSKDYKMDKLEKSWEKGDEEEELEMEHEINRKVSQRVQSKKLDMSDPKAIANMFKKDPLAAVSIGGGGGPVMMFADIKPTQANGKKWTKKAIDDLAGKWAALLRTGSITCSVYSIGTEIDDPKFLLHVDKGWQASDAVRFALAQPECKKITKDNKDFTPEEYPPDRDLDD